jgi:hypothetical protein
MSTNTFNLLNLLIALAGVIMASTALIQNHLRDRRRIEIKYFGSHILLVNHTRRPVNIEDVYYEHKDGTFSGPILTEFGESIEVPAEKQKIIEIGYPLLQDQIPKYVIVCDVLGKKYRAKISREEFDYFNEQRETSSDNKS